MLKPLVEIQSDPVPGAWEGEVITQMYERTDGDLVIIIETGRAIVIRNPKISHMSARDPHKPIESNR